MPPRVEDCPGRISSILCCSPHLSDNRDFMPILSGQISISTSVPQSRHRFAVVWPILDELPTSGSPATLLGRNPKADLQPVQHSSFATAILSTDEVHSRSAYAQSDSALWNYIIISRKWPWEYCNILLKKAFHFHALSFPFIEVHKIVYEWLPIPVFSTKSSWSLHEIYEDVLVAHEVLQDQTLHLPCMPPPISCLHLHEYKKSSLILSVWIHERFGKEAKARVQIWQKLLQFF